MKLNSIISTKTRFTLPILVLTALSLIGCQSYTPFETSASPIHVSPTQLSKYWVIKDKTLDWTPIHAQQPNLDSATISFEINSQGNMVNLIIDELTNNVDIHNAVIIRLSEQKFSATVENPYAQAVMVKTTVWLNEM